jgi:hypothetical protein
MTLVGLRVTDFTRRTATGGATVRVACFATLSAPWRTALSVTV